MPDNKGSVNGRVTTAQHYEAIINVKDELKDTERRILAEIKPLVAMCYQVDTNKNEIDKLRTRSNIIDAINGLFAIVVASVAAAFGKAP